MTYFNDLRLAIVASLMACMFAYAPTLRADEWEENSDYYEDDAWYDISEWFDGNDYNPTDESLWEWDDETYDRSSDTGEDYDNDWDYDYDDGYSFDDNYDYDYSYDYDYDYNSLTGRDSGGDSNWYGYDGVYDDDNWFYDYYDEGYSYYRDGDDDGLYDYSYRYFDYDGDGFYDAFASYNDWDGDGLFDDYNYYSFNEAGSSEENSRESKRQAEQNAKQQRVSGEVVKTKKVSVRDTKNLLVRLKNDKGDKYCFVDVGPVSELDDFDIAEGDQITIRGPISKVGEKKLLIAQQLEANGNSMKIDRDRRSFNGEIADTRTITLRDREHRLVMLKTGSNKKKAIDLGPASSLDVELSEGDQITVHGPTAKINDRYLVFAQTLTHDDEQIEIDRRPDASGRSQRSDRDRMNDQAGR